MFKLFENKKIGELIASAESTKHDIICIQEHRHSHEDIPIKEQTFGKWILLTCSAWKNSINASNGGIGILVNLQTYNTIANVEMITPRIMIATFHGNPETTVISYSPTNVSDEIDTEIFYSDLSSLIRQVPKHNVISIGSDFNAQLGQNNFKQAYNINSNRNGEMLKYLLLENKLVCLNTLFQKRQGQKWTHIAPNTYTSQIDYVIINKKWMNSAKNCRAYNSFASIASDHRIVSAQIKLNLRANKKKTSKNKPYEWSCLKKNTEIIKSFITKVKNRFEFLLNTSSTKTADSTFAHFETSCKEIAKEIIPLKPKLKKRLPWETLEISNKRTISQETAEKRNNGKYQKI